MATYEMQLYRKKGIMPAKVYVTMEIEADSDRDALDKFHAITKEYAAEGRIKKKYKDYSIRGRLA